jgi:acetyl esterase/lipase
MRFYFLILFYCLNVSAVSSQEIVDTLIKPVVFPKGYSASLNVVYTKVNDWEGKLDLYLPPSSNQKTPVLINIHGGGWSNGSKEQQGGFNPFFKEGFAVANIEYRLRKQATAPAAIEDARCALIYLIKNAKALNIDVNKIVVMGSSAGGHLALMAGLLENNHLFDNNCSGVENIKVAAIIDKYGITDVWELSHNNAFITSKSSANWLGDKKTDSIFGKSVSPISYVKKTSPPVFIIHGDADLNVDYQQSVELYKKYQSVGVKSEFITVPGGLHGKFDKEKNTEINIAIMKFISEVIK